MIEILALSEISLLAIKYFSPIQPYREKLVDWVIRLMVGKNWWILNYPAQIISCAYCFSFWMSLAVTLSLYKASIVAILTLLILHVVEALKKYLDEE
jgi:amino acid permease